VAFCEDCGSRLAPRCPSCGAEAAFDRRFCGACGAALDASTAYSRFASPQVYTPDYLIERIRTSRRELEGERKQVTVLFADVRGSMELIADRDPEEARVLLDRIIELMMEAVHRYEGMVNQVAGDGLMALFGAPVSHEDHAARSCYSALTMQESIERYVADLRSRLAADIKIRVGLNSGEVLIRSIRNDLRMDYTATGRSVHLAARMEQMARPGTTLITGTTLALIEGMFDIKPLGPARVKGLTDPVAVYELAAAHPSRSRFQATMTVRGLSRLTGREAELHRLDEIHQQLAHQGQLVALVGEPGVGKSRLIYEFARSRETLGSIVLVGQAASYANRTGYYSIVCLLKSYFGIETCNSHEEIRANVAEKLLALDQGLEDTIPALHWLLDLSLDDDQWQSLDAAGRRERTVTSLKRLFLAASRLKPLLLVFEDLHWIDSETQAFLDNFIGILPTTQIMLTVTYRPEYEHHWGGRGCYTQLGVRPLRPLDAEQLLTYLLGEDKSLSLFKDTLITRSQGNPLFIEELIRAFVESKVLVGEAGAYTTSFGIEAVNIPPSVQAVLAARIDRLMPPEKRVLQSAAVVGTDVPLALLREILKTDKEGLHSILPMLEEAELLYQTALYPEVIYTFKHSLTQEVAYSELLQEHRRVLHAEVLEAVERLYAGRIAEHIEEFARHALRGERWEKAALYLRQAGEQAAQRSAHQAAVVFFRDALTALGRLPAAAGNLAQAIELHFAARNSLWALWDHPAMLEHLKEAEQLATTLGDKRQLGLLASFMIQHYRIVGEPDQAIGVAQRAFSIARDLEDFDLEIDTNFRLGLTYLNLGEYSAAAEYLYRNVRTLDAGHSYTRIEQPGLPAVLSRAWLAISLAEQGRFEEAFLRSSEAMSIAKEADHTYSLVSAFFGQGGVQLYQCDLSAAQQTLEAGLAMCRQYDIRVLRCPIMSELGYAYLLAGRLFEAVSLLEEAAEVNRTNPTSARHTLYLAWLGEAYLRLDRVEQADRLCRRAIKISRQRKERGHEAWALRLSGEIFARMPNPDRVSAAAALQSAISQAEQLQMRPLVASSRVRRGNISRDLGNFHEARRELRSALLLLRELRISHSLPSVENALLSIGCPFPCSP
jgi:class 3 adenylate cyclase/tetratricopeptide (TPR) repeat protein